MLPEVAEKLPPDATLESAIYELEFRQAVQQGLDELDRGEGIPIEEVKAVVPQPDCGSLVEARITEKTFLAGRARLSLSVAQANKSSFSMGEVRVKVRITNSADAQAAQAGRLAPEQVRSLEADALVDTGAVRSCIPAPLVARLGLVPFDSSLVEYADGRKEPVGLVDGLRFEVMNRRSGDEALILGDEVLLGQTILEKMDLMVDCARRRVVPNPAHPDVAVSKVK